MGFRMSLVVLVTTLTCACAPTVDLTPSDLDAAKATVHNYIQAVLDGDWNKATSYFADDAVRLPMNAPAERGAAMIREHFTAIDSVPSFTVHAIEAGGSANVAYVTFYFTLTAYFGGNSEPFTYTGKQLVVLERQPNNDWLIVTDMWNGDGSPAP